MTYSSQGYVKNILTTGVTWTSISHTEPEVHSDMYQRNISQVISIIILLYCFILYKTFYVKNLI